MVIEFSKFVDAESRAIDYVEAEFLNVPKYHEKRVAFLANRVGAKMGMDGETLYALTIAGAMHDSALFEYLQDEISGDGGRKTERDMASHCTAGERVMKKHPFYARAEGAVLYHHERADGGGAFGLTADSTPLCARVLHIADAADVKYGLYSMDPGKYRDMMEWIRAQEGTLFDREVIEGFCGAMDYEALMSITGEGVVDLLDAILPGRPVDIPASVVCDISTFLAHITDYKSHFTWQHSLGVAEKAEKLGRYYGFPEEHCQKLFIAGALHDIGKLLISNDILEKPGKLSSEEYRSIQNHAIGTWEFLHDIGGLEDIARWAALHHEKLDGSGYPFGYTAEELSHEERLMACLDIYQALVEKRPYKEGLSHEDAIVIMRRMGSAGQLDGAVIEDIERCYEQHSAKPAAPAPAPAAVPRYEGEAWRCPVCGYIVEGELPEDFICPRCEQPGTIFERA